MFERLPVHEVEEVVMTAQRTPLSDRLWKHLDVVVSAEFVEKSGLPGSDVALDRNGKGVRHLELKLNIKLTSNLLKEIFTTRKKNFLAKSKCRLVSD